MKQQYPILFTLLFLLFFGFTSATYAVQSGKTEITLTVLGTTENSKAVKIDYSIPYPGYVEFFLFNQDDPSKKIWYKAQVCQRGEHSLSINRGALKAGVEYLFKFGYKGKVIKGEFNVG